MQRHIDAESDEDTQRLLLRLGARKSAECRFHHVIASVAMRGTPTHDTVFGSSGDAVRQPSMRGVILTAQLTLVPNFQHTPRVVYPSSLVSAAMEDESPLLVMPALNARLVRLYFSGNEWRFATNRGPCAARTVLVSRFKQALHNQSGKAFAGASEGWDRSRVLFFLVPRDGTPSVHCVGSCELLRLRAPGDGEPRWAWRVVGDATLRREALEAVPAVPLLGPLLAGEAVGPWLAARLDPDSLRYTGPYNGVVVVHPATMAAVRLMDPLAFLLGHLVEGRERDPRYTILRVLLLHYVVGGGGFVHFACRMQFAFAIHATIAALCQLFPAEYTACADAVMRELRTGGLQYTPAAHLGRLIDATLRLM